MATSNMASSNSDMDADWEAFLTHKVNSFIKWDLVRFFHDNPHTADTAENIARYTGRDHKTIHRELNGLVESGVLTLETIGDADIYRLTTDADIRARITEFVQACHDRRFRVKAIHYLIQSKAFNPRYDF